MTFDDMTLARILHVIAIVGWIGGVWFVTFVVMPALSRSEAPETRLAAFHRIESGFAPQARIWVLLAGASGFWMTHRADIWSRFALMLFVIEPLFLHKRMAESQTPQADFLRMVAMHRALSVIAVVTVFGAMGGAHGLF